MKGFFEADRDRLGYVANYTRVFANRPEVYAAWMQLNGAIKRAMDLRRYELRRESRDGIGVRPYPLHFRDLPPEQQSKKYETIEVDVRKSSDPRP